MTRVPCEDVTDFVLVADAKRPGRASEFHPQPDSVFAVLSIQT